MFDIYMVCKCGWVDHERLAFGERFHWHKECCPRCGADKYEVKPIKGRWTGSFVSWWNPFSWREKFEPWVEPIEVTEEGEVVR